MYAFGLKFGKSENQKDNDVLISYVNRKKLPRNTSKHKFAAKSIAFAFFAID